MLSTIRKTATTVAAVGTLGFGGAAIAGAADTTSAGTSSSSSTASAPWRGDRPQRQALSSAVAGKVKAAALAKVPGATVVRTESGGPYNSAYHAHIRTAGGARRVVLVNGSFEATAVQAERARGGGPRGHGGHGETALTGETKQKVEAAVLARYPGATILRSETENGSTAPYEAHVRTSDSKELEVLVSKDFTIVSAHQHAARR